MRFGIVRHFTRTAKRRTRVDETSDSDFQYKRRHVRPADGKQRDPRDLYRRGSSPTKQKHQSSFVQTDQFDLTQGNSTQTLTGSQQPRTWVAIEHGRWRRRFINDPSGRRVFRDIGRLSLLFFYTTGTRPAVQARPLFYTAQLPTTSRPRRRTFFFRCTQRGTTPIRVVSCLSADVLTTRNNNN